MILVISAVYDIPEEELASTMKAAGPPLKDIPGLINLVASTGDPADLIMALLIAPPEKKEDSND